MCWYREKNGFFFLWNGKKKCNEGKKCMFIPKNQVEFLISREAISIAS